MSYTVLDAMEDVLTHYHVWREALEHQKNNAEVKRPDIDDVSYYQHEIDVLDKIYTTVLNSDIKPQGYRSEVNCPPQCITSHQDSSGRCLCSNSNCEPFKKGHERGLTESAGWS